ncbi:hypothetical protein EN829_020485 [Mesorhizobium sp. M00.F.Ca.ET.186.01.1.1]|nr:hypothetical protein EN848_28870 [bacterium M00.F.Ca.ET.205.01.1.1]TGU50398.1 hypothetical protein EN795_22530 [bacterium M00.F.Ca.ET.152.01.1.1]TGV33872.1 hypothetical protein EN829_020485 [Mesorhizobium sp. M00.F.Ca.ET.186.01.1.1]TGZ40762.1 hypothetical protein EN805_21925 [bacterium M00.F.Ca.ET.162.01.1.1]
MRSAVLAALAVAVTGCVSSPVEYGASLSPQDPKWATPECQQARTAASDYDAREKQHPGWGTGVFLGPYGLGLAAAIKEHEQKERKIFAQQIYLRCSSLPLPKELQGEPSPPAATKYP